ncbi:hypothetical protein MRX96_007523 [Rhipicephalus microplus]
MLPASASGGRSRLRQLLGHAFVRARHYTRKVIPQVRAVRSNACDAVNTCLARSCRVSDSALMGSRLGGSAGACNVPFSPTGNRFAPVIKHALRECDHRRPSVQSSGARPFAARGPYRCAF